MTVGVTRYVVQCLSLVYHDGQVGICGCKYACIKREFHTQDNRCPTCKSYKARWVGPHRLTDNPGEKPPKKPKEDA